jgi:hypothetical protein
MGWVLGTPACVGSFHGPSSPRLTTSCMMVAKGTTIHVQWAVPGRPGPGTAWPGTMDTSPNPAQFGIVSGRPAGWLTRPRPGTVILTRVVPGRRHGGPIVPGRARSYKHKKHSKIQNLKVLFKFILDLVNYIYNFRYIFRQRISDTYINTYHKSECSHIITYYKYYS